MQITRELLEHKTGCNYYDGSALHRRQAYNFLGKSIKRTGDIIAFVAPMDVTTNLIDLEDVNNKDFIYSDKAINFIIEIPSIDLFGGICFQRLFNTYLGSLLAEMLGVEVAVDGDDIMVGDKKASVSITADINNAVMIHTGINISAGSKAPDFAFSTNFTDEQTTEFINKATAAFYEMTQDIFVASAKVLV